MPTSKTSISEQSLIVRVERALLARGLMLVRRSKSPIGSFLVDTREEKIVEARITEPALLTMGKRLGVFDPKTEEVR